MQMEENDFPALFNSADSASLVAQRNYFNALSLYLFFLISAAFVSFKWPKDLYGVIASASLFLITMGILVWLKMQKPENIWYNGRAVAESVKTRTWRWIMKAEPYDKDVSEEEAQKELLSDLKAILYQNRSLSNCLKWSPDLGKAISDKMISIRKLQWGERLEIYKKDRIDNQLVWYSKKSLLNKHYTKLWFTASVFFHALAIFMLIYRIKDPNISLPVEAIATAASGALTWVQAKKYNELSFTYALASQEIVLIKGEAGMVQNEFHLSEFVVNSESAFSREHTQWAARNSL